MIFHCGGWYGLRKALLLFLLVAAPVLPAWAHSSLPASGTVEVAFTPWDDAEGAIIRMLSGARHEIYVQAYLFTSRNLANALLEAQRRGVQVLVLADRDMVVKGENSQIPRFARAGIPVWLETRYAVAHNKIMLIDPHEPGAAVMTGSYNYTYSAQARNAENVLILRGNLALVRAYLDNWLRHRSEATVYREIRGVEP